MAGLIAYYSRAGSNYVNGEIKNLEIGNTRILAGFIHEYTNAPLFEICPLVPYSEDYSQCVMQARKDMRSQARPKLAFYPQELEKYDTLFLGFPNYWGTMPMCVFTFMELFSWRGRRINVFCTHEGDGYGSSLEDLKRLCPEADIHEGPAVRGAHAAEGREIINKWLKGL